MAATRRGKPTNVNANAGSRHHLDAAEHARLGVGDGELAEQRHDAGGALQGDPRGQARR